MKPNLFNCAYAVAAITPTAGQFPFVSLFNNSNVGFYLAVREMGVRNNSLTPVQSGYTIQKGQQGSNPVTTNPVVTSQAAPQGVVTSGSIAALPTFGWVPQLPGTGPAWIHPWPIIVLAQGWSMTAYAAVVTNLWTFGFWWELVDTDTLMGVKPPPRLEIPKVITLTVESD